MNPYYDDGTCVIYHGDCFDLLHDLSGVDAVVTDPPYSSGGAFRGDRAMQTSIKYVQTDTAAYRPEFAGDNRDQRSFFAWSSLWLMAAYHAAAAGPPGGLILDPFMGSGTTLRAAKDTSRRAIGIEVDERCCEEAAKRFTQEVLDFGASA